VVPCTGVLPSQQAATERTPSLKICGDLVDSGGFGPGNLQTVSGFRRLDRLRKKIPSASARFRTKPRPRSRVDCNSGPPGYGARDRDSGSIDGALNRADS
jgi:hypothetical protein